MVTSGEGEGEKAYVGVEGKKVGHYGIISFFVFVLPFHTVHELLKAKILKWFAISFSSGPC